MSKSAPDERSIDKHRLSTERRLMNLLQGGKNALTLDIVKNAIFESKSGDFHIFVAAVLDELNCDNIEDVDESTIQLISDAWNYFPHRVLDGRSPVEAMMESLCEKQ